MSRVVVLLLVIGIVALGIFAWSKTLQRTQAPGGPPPQSESPVPPEHGGEIEVRSAGDPGVTWSDPPGWTREPGGTMRIATYRVPAAPGAAGGSCAVYYFGPEQGGGVDDNLRRWAGEFANGGEPERRDLRHHGLAITRVRLEGRYASHGAMGGSDAVIENAELLGAIVEGPKGRVFFKLTGPAVSVSRAAPSFDAMLASMRPQESVAPR